MNNVNSPSVFVFFATFISTAFIHLGIGEGAIAQVAPAPGGTNTRVTRQGERFIIDGGTLSSDERNLFHSFESFGLSAEQIATFLANPDLRNILGRVVGGSPSLIDGLVEVSGGTANLFLMNPAGVIFGPNARLDVSGDFTATTATGIGFEDGMFQAIGENDYAQLVGDPSTFAFATSVPGSIVNAGDLRVPTGSSLTLLGGTVINSGTLAAPGGEITVAAVPGDRLVRISHDGLLLNLEIETLDPSDAAQDAANPAALPFTPLALPELLTGSNLGNATGVEVNADGSVRLTGSSASVAATPGTALVSGYVTVESASENSALASVTESSINVLGDRIALLNADVDASGPAGGGTIRIGGDYQGQGEIPNAQLTYVDATSTLAADALSASSPANGGRIIIWADQTTQFYGAISARGADGGGDGGFVEISGLEHLAFDGQVDVGAPAGEWGTVLFDPRDINIITGVLAGADDAQLDDGVIFGDDGGTAVDFEISDIALTSVVGDVILQASRDINLQTDLDFTNTSVTGLDFLAGRDVNGADQSITAPAIPIEIEAGGDITLGDLNTSTLLSDTDGGSITLDAGGAMTVGNLTTASLADVESGDGGTIQLTSGSDLVVGDLDTRSATGNGGAIALTADGSITTAAMTSTAMTSTTGSDGPGGDIRLAADEDENGEGRVILEGSVTTTGRSIDITGRSVDEAGITVIDGTLDSGGGEVSLDGASTNAPGVLFSGTASINSAGGDVDVTGESAGPVGIALNSANPETGETITSEGGDITLRSSSTIIVDGTLNASAPDSPSSEEPEPDDSGDDSGDDAGDDADPGDDGSDDDSGVDDSGLDEGGVLIESTNGDIVVQDIDTRSSIEDGRPITLRAPNGLAIAGDLNSSGQSGGDILIEAQTRIRTGTIVSRGLSENGGDVTLDPDRNVRVSFIDAQGGVDGVGGTVDITAGRFFRATDTFIDDAGVVASISTIGGLNSGLEGGAITIRHGGGRRDVPFIVGRLNPVNGTVGAMTRGELTLSPRQSFRESFSQNSIQILTDGEDVGGVGALPLVASGPCPPDCDRTSTEPPNSSSISMSAADPSVQQSILTVEDATQVLQRIEREAGIRPALIYVSFVPAQISLNPGFSQLEIAATEEVLDYFGRTDEALAVNEELEIVHEPQQTDQLELLLLTPDGEVIRRQLRGVTRSEMRDVSAQLFSQVTNPRYIRTTGYLPSAQQLYRWIIEPLEADLQEQGIENLSFVMDSGLRSLPIAALHNGEQFLVERYSLGLMPSLNLVDTRYRDIRNMQVLAMGAKDFVDQPSLPAVPVELEAITDDLWSGVAVLGDRFTITNLKLERQERPFGIVHLATHGEFRPGSPEQSYIQFGDRRLRLSELRELGLNDPTVELLVLSACRTAIGDEDAELGFAGLALQAGVKSALASLWYVSDEGTLGFMTEFYRQLQDAPIRSEALRQAQIAMLNGDVRLEGGVVRGSRGGMIPLPPEITSPISDDLSHPFFWAAFTMVGSPW